MASGLGRGHSCNLRAGVMVVNRALLNVLSLLIIAGVSLPQSELTLVVHLVVSESSELSFHSAVGLYF